jgi:hypothetical protein
MEVVLGKAQESNRASVQILGRHGGHGEGHMVNRRTENRTHVLRVVP